MGLLLSRHPQVITRKNKASLARKQLRIMVLLIRCNAISLPPTWPTILTELLLIHAAHHIIIHVDGSQIGELQRSYPHYPHQQLICW